MEAVGIFKLIKRLRDKEKKQSKKGAIVLIVIPFVFVYSMFFSGMIRRTPMNRAAIESTIDKVTALIEQEGEEQFQGNYREYKNDKDEIYCFVRLNYHNYFTEEKDSDEEDILDKIEDLFSKTGEYKGKKYYCSPLFSCKGVHWEGMCHCGYDSAFRFEYDENRSVDISFRIFRPIDTVLGFFYSPPVWRNYDLGEYIKTGEFFGTTESVDIR